MDCRRVREVVFLYTDNEMGEELLISFREHVDLCPTCARRIDRTSDGSSNSLIAYTERLIRDYERDPDVTGTYEPVSLPAGPATRVWIREDVPNPVAHTEYVLQHDGSFYRLACRMFDPREDDWLSVAEGLEFPPE